MKYKVGDRVRIKNLDWYNENKDEDNNVVCLYSYFDKGMSEFCDKIVTIKSLHGCPNVKAFRIIEDNGYSWWSDDMIEGLVEPIDCKKCGLTRMSTRCLFMDNCPHNQPKHTIEIPKGWIPKDENGNVINATKIVLEKKKKEYPKTYEECCEILEDVADCSLSCFACGVLNNLQKLLLCRAAYWKIAGDELGLGKPWEPDWTSTKYKYCITTRKNKVEPLFEMNVGFIFAFPTEEMRDAFYENFKELIEQCKELL